MGLQTPGRLTYSVAEAAAVLGISRSFCYELVQQGGLPVVLLGRRKLIPRGELERYLRQHTRTPATMPSTDDATASA